MKTKRFNIIRVIITIIINYIGRVAGVLAAYATDVGRPRPAAPVELLRGGGCGRLSVGAGKIKTKLQ